jgi:hypothetical protein
MCRACGCINDFEAVEEELNAELYEDGIFTRTQAGTRTEWDFATLSSYRCRACGFAVSPEPGWFITKVGDPFVFIESGFEPIPRPS